MKLSLCMLISQPRMEHIRFACTSLRKFWDPDEILLGASKNITSENLEAIRYFFHPTKAPIRILPGAETRSAVARARFNLFDSAMGEWICSLDDDDGVVRGFDLDLITKRDLVGFIHTGILGVFQEQVSGQVHRAGDIIHRETKEVIEPKDADGLRGSHYFYRNAAWKQVSPIIDREETAYEEWRVVWHMRHLGWEGHLIRDVCQVQRVRDWVKEVQAHRDKTGLSWEKVVESLEKEHGKPDKRWWQNWNDTKKRDAVIEYWKEDPLQAERRKHFENLMTGVAKEGKFLTVLDFSCGTCEDFPFLVTAGLEYKGVDVSAAMLSTAQSKYPLADISIDDIFKSKFSSGEHPLVINSAVLPHLPLVNERSPLEAVPTAIKELWRITGRCLVIRLFGVDRYDRDTVKVQDSFIYNTLREWSWRKLLSDNMLPAPRRLDVHRGSTEATKDIMVVVAWK